MRASLAVVLLLLASVGTASAECAWAVWLVTEAVYERRPGSDAVGQQLSDRLNDPRVVRAYANSEECKADRDVKQGWSLVTGFRTGPDSPIWIGQRHICLPDTIDPRGPKGM
jgi:hypothetical protein